MGSSYIKFRDNGFWATDDKIELWLGIMALEIDRLSRVPDWLRPLHECWRAMGRGEHPMGVVVTRLDEHVRSQAQLEYLGDLAQTALRWLDEHGPVLRADELNGFAGSKHSYWTQDVPAEAFFEVATRFIRLLRGQWRTDPWEDVVNRLGSFDVRALGAVQCLSISNLGIVGDSRWIGLDIRADYADRHTVSIAFDHAEGLELSPTMTLFAGDLEFERLNDLTLDVNYRVIAPALGFRFRCRGIRAFLLDESWSSLRHSVERV